MATPADLLNFRSDRGRVDRKVRRVRGREARGRNVVCAPKILLGSRVGGNSGDAHRRHDDFRHDEVTRDCFVAVPRRPVISVQVLTDRRGRVGPRDGADADVDFRHPVDHDELLWSRRRSSDSSHASFLLVVASEKDVFVVIESTTWLIVDSVAPFRRDSFYWNF